MSITLQDRFDNLLSVLLPLMSTLTLTIVSSFKSIISSSGMVIVMICMDKRPRGKPCLDSPIPNKGMNGCSCG